MSKMQAKMNSNLGTIPLVGIDPSMADVFGRLKITNHQAMFDTDLEYGLQATRWESLSSANASILHRPSEGGVVLTLNAGAVAGNYAIRQTKRYFRYQSGKQQYTSAAALFGLDDPNVINRVGIFDDCNGLFFEQNPADSSDVLNSQGIPLNPNGISVVKRANIAGVPTDTKVAKQNWNVDKMDGNGPSAISLDFTKLQMFSIQYAWYGAGIATFGFYIDGRFYPCHTFRHANIVTQAYMRTGNLPARYEIRATGTLATATNLYHYGTSVMTEGRFDVDRGYIFAGSNGSTPITTGLTARRPICSIRAKQMGAIATTGTVATAPVSQGLTVAGTPWVANAYAGLFYVATSGTHIGKPQLIASNTTNSLTFDGNQILYPLNLMTAGDTFSIGLLNRGGILPTDGGLYTGGGVSFIEFVLNGTLTGANFQDIGGTSLSQRDVSATAIAGGETVASYYATANTITFADLRGLYPLGLNTRGLTSDILSVVVTPLTGQTLTGASANIRFSEAQS